MWGEGEVEGVGARGERSRGMEGGMVKKFMWVCSELYPGVEKLTSEYITEKASIVLASDINAQTAAER